MTNNPCKDCNDRYPGCHAECEAYKIWRQEYDGKKVNNSWDAYNVLIEKKRDIKSKK